LYRAKLGEKGSASMVSLRSGSVVGKDQAVDIGAAEVTSRKSGNGRKSLTPEPPASTLKVSKRTGKKKKPTELEEKDFLTSESAHASTRKFADAVALLHTVSCD
jgi:hypothetical protein